MPEEDFPGGTEEPEGVRRATGEVDEGASEQRPREEDSVRPSTHEPGAMAALQQWLLGREGPRQIEQAGRATRIILAVSLLGAMALLVVSGVYLIGDYLQTRTFHWILLAIAILFLVSLIVYLVLRERSNFEFAKVLLERREETNKRLMLLLDAGRALGSTLELKGILLDILEYAFPLTDADVGAVYLLERDGDDIRLATVRGVDEHKVMFKEFPLSKGIMGEVAVTREMRVVEDMGEIDERDNVFFGAATPGSQVMVPLLAQEKFMGVLVAATGEPRRYSEEEKRLLLGFAELAGLSLANAELYRIARRSLDAAAQQRGLTESVLGQMVAGVITCDRRGRITAFNQEAERLTGYTFTERTQMRLKPELSLDENPFGPLEHGMLEVLEDPATVREGEALIMKKDKTILPVSYRVYPLSDGSELLGAAAVFMETRERGRGTKRGEGIDYQVLLRSLGARVEMLYTLPLSRVLDRVRSLDLDSWARSKEDIIDILEAGSVALLTLLEDVEQYLNCVTTREWDAKEEHDLTVMVGGVVDELLKSWEREAVVVMVRLEDLSPAYGYGRMIRSALEEVLENAVIASADGGKKVEITGSNTDGFVRIEVKDTGPGLSDEVRRHMFIPFFTTREGRPGLGLSIVYRVMGRTGGKVGAEDVPGGTLFYLEFPVAPRPGGGDEGEG